MPLHFISGPLSSAKGKCLRTSVHWCCAFVEEAFSYAVKPEGPIWGVSHSVENGISVGEWNGGAKLTYAAPRQPRAVSLGGCFHKLVHIITSHHPPQSCFLASS